MKNQACFAALEKVDVYEHSRTESWNTSIIVIIPRIYGWQEGYNTKLYSASTESHPTGIDF